MLTVLCCNQQAAGAAAFEAAEEAPQALRHLMAEAAEVTSTNTTLSLSGVMVPGPTYTSADVITYLNTEATRPGEPMPDLCNVDLNSLSICDGTEFYSIPVAFSSARAVVAGMRVRELPDASAP